MITLLLAPLAAHAQSYQYLTPRTVAFEDIAAPYPASDLDLNDVVLRYRSQCVFNAGGQVAVQNVHFAAVASGADLVDALWVVPVAPVASATLRRDADAPVALTGTTAVELFADFTAAFTDPPDGFVNTDGGEIASSPAWSLQLVYATPVASASCPDVPFEVRSPDDVIALGTQVGPNNQPVAGTFAGWWPPPAERVSVSDAYPWLDTWLDGGCATSADPVACLAWEANPIGALVLDRVATIDATAPLPGFDSCTDGTQNGTEAGVDCNDSFGLCPVCTCGGTLPAGSVATATSGYPGYPTSQAIDGNLGTAWSSGGYAGSITVTFASPTWITAANAWGGASPASVETWYVYGVQGGVTTLLLTETPTVYSVVTAIPTFDIPDASYDAIRFDIWGGASWVAVYELSFTAPCP